MCIRNLYFHFHLSRNSFVRIHSMFSFFRVLRTDAVVESGVDFVVVAFWFTISFDMIFCTSIPFYICASLQLNISKQH